MRHAVFGMPDGTVALVNPTAAYMASRPAGVTVKAWIAAAAKEAEANTPALATAIRLADADTEDLIPHPKLRDALRHNGLRAAIDLGAARQVVMGQLRKKRSIMLDESDRDAIRLTEAGTDEQRAAIKVYRQQLRDLPATVQTQLDAITDVSQLAVWQPMFPEKPAA